MSKLKVIAIALLGIFLSLALVIFGLVFTVKMTALNDGFVNARLNALDISTVAEEAIDEQASKGELPEEFTEEFRVALFDTVDRMEPLIKERVSNSINSTYDYLLGRKENPDLALTLKNNLLNSEFIASLLEELDTPSLLADVDISSLALEFLSQQSSEEMPEEVKYLAEYVDEIIIELEPWLKEQASAMADPIFSYLLGESQNLNVLVSMEPVREALDNTLRAVFLESPPAELAGLSQAELEQFFDEHYRELIDGLPLAYELDASALESTKTEITKALADAEDALTEARMYIGYFNLAYGLLIFFILLLIAGIILVYRDMKGASRTLGSTFLTYGIFNLIAVFVARGLAKSPIAQLDIPPSLQTWLTQIINSSLTPLLILAIVLLIIGVALLATSIIYPRRQRIVATETIP